MMIPRFTGRAFEVPNGWSWECHVSVMGSGDPLYGFNSKQIFRTKQEAIDNLKESIRDLTKILAATMPQAGIVTNQYIDMKTNETRQWDKSDEH